MKDPSTYCCSTDEAKISIFIVVVHNTLREVVRTLIEKSAHLILCGEASSIEEAIEKIGRCLLKPEVVLVDIFSPSKDVTLVPSLKARSPGIQLLATSGYNEPDIALRTLAAGAAGYLLKEELTRLDEVVAEMMNSQDCAPGIFRISGNRHEL